MNVRRAKIDWGGALTKRSGVIALALLVVGLLTLFVLTPPVHAGGVGGGGGDAGGDGGTYFSAYGWGWRVYSLNSGGPAGGFRNGTPWSFVQATCRDDSTAALIFVINNANGTKQKAYDYHSKWYYPPQYSGYRSGPSPWMPVPTAQAAYDALPGDLKRSFTWGQDVGWFCYGPLPSEKWSTHGTTAISRTSISPGQSVTWTHRAYNDGAAKTNKAIRATTSRTGVANAAARGSNAGVGVNGIVASASTTFVAKPSDAGKTICERLNWSPNSSDSAATESSAQKCVVVSYDFELHPTIAIGQTTLNQGDSIKGISATINNTATTTTLGNSATAVVRFVVPKTGGSLVRTTESTVTLGNNSNYGCQIAAAVAIGLRDCTDTLYNQPGGRRFSTGTTNLVSGVVDNAAAGLSLTTGDRICYITVVNSYNETSSGNNWRHSPPRCAVVASTPMVQVWGNDVRVGSPFVSTTATPFATETTPKNGIVQGSFGTYAGKIKGSWGEYGVMAPTANPAGTASVIGFGSGAGLGVDTASAAPSSWSTLTFANTTMGTLGNFAQPAATGSIPDIADYLQKIAPKAGLSVMRQNGNISINQYVGNQILVVNGTVTITGDITGQGTLGGYQELQQMVIIAKSIKINSTVARVDAWLIASGKSPEGVIDTCADKSGSLTTSTGPNSCDTLLTVTGPLMARVVTPRRTGGGGPDAAPAEVYNLRDDAYLWSYHVAQSNNTLHTVYTQELPPRY